MTKPLSHDRVDLPVFALTSIEPVDLLGFASGLWQGRWTVALTTLLTVLIAGYYAFCVASPQYAATATLQIDLRGPEQDQTAGLGIDIAQLNTQATILRSRHLSEQVIAKLNLTEDPEFNRYLVPLSPWSITALRTRLRSFLTGSDLVQPDPTLTIEKTVENLQAALSITPDRGTYIFAITATTAAPVRSAEIANSLAKAYLTDQINAQQTETNNAVDALTERVATLRTETETLETAITALLMTGQVQDAALLDPLSRQAIDTDQRLAEAQRTLSLDPEDINAQAQIRALETYRDSLTAKLATQSAGLVQLQQLRREVTATRTMYQTLLDRLNTTRVQHGLDLPRSRILSPASTGRYAAPRKILILAIATLLGTLLGGGVVLFRQRGILRPAAMSIQLDRRILAQFPKLPRFNADRLLRQIGKNPRSPTAEAASQLRTALLFTPGTQPPGVILVTSSTQGEGKTTTAIALSDAMARLGLSVLLVEANLHQRSIAAYFPASDIGIVAVIKGATRLADAITVHPDIKADVLCAETSTQNPSDLLSSAGYADLSAQARAAYDVVVIDAPAVLNSADAAILAQTADSIIYVVQANKTRLPSVQQGYAALRAVNADIRGLVITHT